MRGASSTGLTATLLVLLSSAVALAQDDDATTALVHATVWTGEGEPIEDATVVLREGEIVSVTPGGAAPAGAREIDCTGAIVTAGFVGTQSALGLVELELEASTTDQAPEGDDADPIRASFSVVDGYNPLSSLIPVARRGGVTSVVSTPNGGLVSGTSAWLDLDGATLDDALTDDAAALHVSLGDSAVAATGGARSAALDRLRDALDDARLYQSRRAQFDRRQVRELSVSRRDLERLGEALAGELPVVVRVARASDILRALALASDYGLRLVLAGVEEGWLVSAQIAAADVPVILQPLTNLPAQFSQLHARYDNAALLERAGVRIIVATDGAHGQRTLRQEAGNAIATGLSRDAALRGLTVEPARAFGLEDRYGTVEAGRVANLVVWTGDPFELTTWAREVFIRGRPVDLRSRQTLLFDRYRESPCGGRRPGGRPCSNHRGEP